MFTAPMLKPLKLSGGSLYVFPTASNDIAKTFSDDDARFVFDKYVLLDLPDIKTPINDSNDIVFEAIGANPNTSSIPVPPGLNADDNFNVASAFQNYCMNFESLILSGQNNAAQPYDNSTTLSTSERVFWKFLKEINAIRWESATTESSIANRFVEDKTNQYYKKVVKCIGDIDLINSVNRSSGSYTEVYIHIPTSYGTTPEVLFKTVSDANYTPNRSWIGSDEYISGRTASSSSPVGLSLKAWYDDDSTNTYNSFADFQTTTNVSKTVNLDSSLSSKNVLISNLDGVCVDFDVNSYSRAIANGFERFDELNTSVASEDFTFNAVLIYYTVYSAANPSVSSRNLYGILFVDNVTNTVGSGSYINRLKKVKPNRFTNVTGNSYGLKLNIKFDAYSETVGVENTINDYSTFSMDLFSDLMVNLQSVNDNYLSVLEINETLRNDILILKNALLNTQTITNLSNRLSELETKFNQMSIADVNTIQQLLSSVNRRINDIISGQIPIQPIQLANFLNSGDGVRIDNIANQLARVSNTVQQYNTFSICRNDGGLLNFSFGNGLTTTSTLNGNVLVLNKFTNRYKHNSTDFVAIDNIIINIEDGSLGWQNGQTFRIVFDSILDLDVFELQITTDSTNKFRNQTNYKKAIANITKADLISNKPIIDIICIDASTYTFDIDIIR